jgi:putative inorganic carbon (HCO3(-)) transporter
MTLAYVCLSTFLLFVYFEPALLLPVLGQVRAAFVVSVLGLVAALVSGARLPKAPQHVGLAFYMCWAFIAAQLAVSRPQAAESVPLYLKAVLLYFAVALTVRSADRLKNFVHYNLLLAAIVGVTTILTTRAGIRSLDGGSLYRMVNYFGGIGDNSNEFAAFMVLMLPLPAALMAIQTSTLKKIAYGVVALAFLLCIVRTRSRGAFVALLCMLPFMYTQSRKSLGTIAVVGLVSIYVATNTHSGYWERIATVFSEEEEEEIDPGHIRRVEQQGFAVALIEERPIIGVGPGNYNIGKVELLRLEPGSVDAILAPHNTYLGIAAEIGIPGLIAFVVTLIVCILALTRACKIFAQDPELEWYRRVAAALRTSLVGFGVAAFFLTEQFNLVMFVWMAMSSVLTEHAALCAAERSRKAVTSPSSAPQPAMVPTFIPPRRRPQSVVTSPRNVASMSRPWRSVR